MERACANLVLFAGFSGLHFLELGIGFRLLRASLLASVAASTTAEEGHAVQRATDTIESPPEGFTDNFQKAPYETRPLTEQESLGSPK